MSTTTARKPAAKPARTLKWFSATGTMVLTVGGKSEAYDLLEVPTGGDTARAFACRKLCQAGPGESYRVVMSATAGCCACKGWQYGGACRHLSAVQALAASGRV